MTSTLQTVGRVLGVGNPREIPRWTTPMLLDPRKCPTLGPVGRRKAFDWPELKLELEENGEPISPNDRSIAEGPYFRLDQADGSYLLQPLTAHLRGWYAEHTAARADAKKVPKPQEFIDALAPFKVLKSIPRDMRVKPELVRGAKRIKDRLADRGGVQFRVSPDRATILLTAEKGDSVYLAAARAAMPLLAPYLLDGSPPPCQVTAHPKPVEATGVADGFPDGLPWCGACRP